MNRPVIALLASAMVLAACGKSPAPPGASTTEVGIVTLHAQAVPLQQELAGRTTAALSADVRPQVGGIIKSRKFTEGARVQSGDVLYEIDPASYQATADQARAAWTSAKAAVEAARLKSERYKELLTIQGVSKQDAEDARVAYEQALANVEQTRAAYESARINLDYTKVRAPISGRIGTSSVTAGALVTAGQTTALATIRALDPMYVDLTQSSASLLRLRRALAGSAVQAGSTTAKLKLEDGTDYVHAGTLQFSEVAVDEATGSVTLRAQFPNPEGTLLPGMYVRAVLDQAVDPKAILAPQQGITRDPKGNATAMVVDAQGQVEVRQVTAERAVGDKWLVTQGLADGDRLIVEGTSKVRSGARVKTVEVTAPPANPSDTTVAKGAATTQER
ncbi:efflux RND transporter periplasmic adaptor subunit [Variovorax sp. YR216]|uniref:efflux RND transporter periplasmic adaptor subunit n=1 Tax=Variovorax sp. YR216 TaxID=1882828 RepID=UPI0008967E2C|nr:efflux RND transporter periplasmic adaptor subunit [Variovorax sp. YR216]SEB25639.1 membrane fusion protein, multidrug efflux system [Variovorax sp. YR216]